VDQALDVLVVGAGLAGAHTALALREAGHRGSLTLLGAEQRPPYDRPPLSKAILTAAPPSGTDHAVATSSIDPTLPIDLDALAVTCRFGEAATALDAHRHVVRTSAGAEIGYDGLVIATGASPVQLPRVQDRRPPRTLRTVDDALGVRGSLLRGSGDRGAARLVIVGAGWIGAEVATAARGAGMDVTVIEAAERPLAGALPASVTSRFAAWYKRAGVRLLLGAPVAAAAGDGVQLADGEWLPAEEVLVAVGVRPATGWLGAVAGLTLLPDGGVPVDEGLRTELPGVYAVGDVAAYVSRRYGTRLRSEHWDNALRGPRVAAANLLGGDETHDPVPYVWSEQFGHMVQYVGRHAASDRLIERDGDGDTGWTACWISDDPSEPKLTAALVVDRPRDFTQARRLIDTGVPVDPARLADVASPLRGAAR
jgi:NADPH-dependent 2,4-dienoyl-CoA reductase/sulfur reductase-like enzyme